jgi:hypothetical protein
MVNPRILFSDTYLRRLELVEDFIWESSGKSVSAVETFLVEHDRVLGFLKLNSAIPSSHPQTGDRSWPFGNGRYRLFYIFLKGNILLLDLIDNRMCNLNIYPSNKFPTYEEE